MNIKREDVYKVIDTLKLNKNIFSEDDLKLIEKGGIPLSDSEIDTESLKDSVTRSVSSMDLAEAKINLQNVMLSKANVDRDNKNKYGTIIIMLEKQIAQLQAEINKLKIENEREIQKIIADYQKKYEKLIEDQKRNTNLKKFVHSKDVLDIVGDIVNNRIPEHDYVRLRDVPERNLKEEEANLVHLWELIYPLKHENEQLKADMTKLREEIRVNNEKYQNLLLELREANSHLERKDDDIRRTMNSYETSIRLLQSELNKATLDVEALREKGTKYDELYRDFVRVEKEKIMLENKVQFFSGTQDIVHEVPKNDYDIKAKYSILCTDKEYLTKENLRLTEQNRKLEDRIDRLEKELEEHKKMAKDYMMQLFNSKNNLFLDYEKKISTELTDLREKHKQEVEMAKTNLKEMYERQISFLKDDKERLEIKIENLESSIREKQTAYDDIIMDNRNLQRKVDHDLSELRINLRLKSDELEKTQTLYEECNGHLKVLKLENDKMREKINVLKSEYYKIESQARDESASIRAQLAVAKEQLKNYETIEKEIDDAIMSVNNGEKIDGVSTNIYLQTITNAPTSSKRRIQQALGLAQKLNIKQKENDELTRKLYETQTRLEQVDQDLNLAKSLIDRSNQPYSYLITTIEDKEKEVLALKQKLRITEEEMKGLKTNNSKLLEDYAQLQKDFNKVTIKRENIKNIQRILLRLLSENRENVSHNELYQLVDEINYITEGKSRDPIMTMMQYEPEQTVEKNMYTPPTKLQEISTKEMFGASGIGGAGGTNVSFGGTGAIGGNKIQLEGKNAQTGPAWFYKLKETMKK